MLCDVDSGRHHVRKFTRPSPRFFPRLRKKMREEAWVRGYMSAPTVLPLITHPVVSSTKYTDIESINEFLDAMMEEPVSDGWVLHQCSVPAGAGVGVIGADQACKLWPLEVSCTVRPSVSTMAMSRLRCFIQ